MGENPAILCAPSEIRFACQPSRLLWFYFDHSPDQLSLGLPDFLHNCAFCHSSIATRLFSGSSELGLCRA
jgi:hypothetical protein